MPQERFMPQDEVDLLGIWTPCTKGAKISAEGVFEPVFKENTPKEIIDKYKEYCHLITIRKIPDEE